MHPSRTFRRLIRRGLRRFRLRPVVCRSADAIALVYRRDMVDAIVLGAAGEAPDRGVPFLERYPRVPVFVAGAFRPGDGALLARYRRLGVQGPFVDGVGDAAGPGR